MEWIKRIPSCARSHRWTVGLIVGGVVVGVALGIVGSLSLALPVGGGIALLGLLRFAYLLGAPAQKPESPGPWTWKNLRSWVAKQTPGANDEQVDPLRNRVAAGGVAILVGVTALVALVLSLGSGAPSRLPAVALSSPALFHLQRMLVPTLAVALLSVFLVRAAFGYFPLKVSTTGAEWGTIAAAQKQLASSKTDKELAASIEALREAQRRHQEAAGELAATTNEQGLALLALGRVVTTLVEGGEAAVEGEWERLRKPRSSD